MRTSRKNPMARRGLIILVVLGMLGLFSLLAVTFLLVASQSRFSAIALEKPHRYETPPDVVAELILKQIVRGTKDANSPFYGHDLLQDVYGNQPVVVDLDEVAPTVPVAYEETIRVRARNINSQAIVVAGSLVSIPLDHMRFANPPMPPQYPGGAQSYGRPIDDDIGLQATGLLIGGDVDDARYGAQPVGDERSDAPQFGQIRAPERELVVGFSLPGADPHVLGGNQEHVEAYHRPQLRPEAGDDALRR